ncbi:MAG: ACT domain-containing protein [Clostridia bacterium]|nr:ACT domain-containing protein [Clostridia bacterium]
MQIQQLSVFIENKPGRLAEITEVLANADVDIRAISVADTSDFGILRVIVDRPKEAVIALREHGMTVSLTNVLAVGIPDEKGSFSKVIRILADAGIDVEYIYAFVSRDKDKAYVIIRTEKSTRAAEVLVQSGVEILTEEALYNM